MKKRFKGFTLVECIVAMAILGVASLLIAQIYGAVATRNKMNHLVNSSLSYQMAYVEKYTDSETVPLYFGNVTNTPDTNAGNTYTPPHQTTKATNDNYVTISKITNDGPLPDVTYSFPTDVYVLVSRDRKGNQLSASGDNGYTEDDYNLRYKYILGHRN